MAAGNKHYIAGPVTIRNRGTAGTTRAPYTDAEVRAIVKQGVERPRPLTHDENTRAELARQVAREDFASMERWYRTVGRGRVGTRVTGRSSENPSQENAVRALEDAFDFLPA